MLWPIIMSMEVGVCSPSSRIFSCFICWVYISRCVLSLFRFDPVRPFAIMPLFFLKMIEDIAIPSRFLQKSLILEKGCVQTLHSKSLSLSRIDTFIKDRSPVYPPACNSILWRGLWPGQCRHGKPACESICSLPTPGHHRGLTMDGDDGRCEAPRTTGFLQVISKTGGYFGVHLSSYIVVYNNWYILYVSIHIYIYICTDLYMYT